MLEEIMDATVRQEFRPLNGLPGLIVGITGGSVTIAQAIQRFDLSTFSAIMLGTAAAFGGLGWKIYCSGLNYLLKESMRLREEIRQIDDRYHEDLKSAEKERIELFRKNAALEGQLARLREQFRAFTPEPDRMDDEK